MLRTLLLVAILGASSQAWGACVQRCGRCDSCRIHPDRVFVEARFVLNPYIPQALGSPQYPDPTPGGVARANYSQSSPVTASKDASQDSILALLTKEIKEIKTVLVALGGGRVSPPDTGPPATPANIPPVLFQSCNKCHSGDKPDGGVLLADLLASEQGRRDADLVVKHGIMPPDSDLPEERRNQLRNAIKGIKP